MGKSGREEGKSVGDRFPGYPCWSEGPSQESINSFFRWYKGFLVLKIPNNYL